MDHEGKSAVHHVVNPIEYGSYENVEIFNLLIANNFDINVKDKKGCTPLDYAI